ncbi:DUF4352 domain-containing protein [Enterococcus xiangfangensis]|uniref:DUF4352 domain-containing protein n=1 Tax=Enterococcus xiangfangensis TaxID=1296537 RepID=UPI0010F4C43A|nr:DUF4352 domain-containing protein [Enterococcus xiangfangensis]MBM7711031.1 hypothetical protein [Enterococcus xiangfangensis]NBK07792.1 DUF4352 domain-containing protein [Enterococcus asini]
MKKIVLGLIATMAIVVLGGCSSGSDETTSSLETQVSDLKTENSDLKKKVTAYEGLLGLDETDDSEESSDVKDSDSSSNELSLNEEGSFQSGEKISIKSIEENPNLELYEPKDGEHPVIVTATVENTSSSPLSFNSQAFDLYDGNSELCTFDASTYDNNIPNSIASGKKATVIIHYSAKGNGPYSVTFGNASWSQD